MKVYAKVYSQEQYERVWLEVSKHYNSIGSVLDMLAISQFYDLYDIIIETPLYRQRVKHSLNECKRIADTYERTTKIAYADKFSLWVDYNTAMQDSLETHVFVLYNSIHRFLSTRNVKDLQLASKVLTIQMLLENAVDFHKRFFESIYEKTKIRRFAHLYSYADLTGMEKRMQVVSHAVTGLSNDEVLDFGHDESIALSLTAINNFLNSEDHLNDAAKVACSMDMDTYGDALREIEEDEKARLAQQSTEPVKAAQSEDMAAIRNKLSNKYKVTQL